MIRRSVSVRVPRDRAFSAWTKHIDLWWPPSHRRGRDASTLILETGPGGRLYESGNDGNDREFGRVVEWDPPARLVWDFFLGTGAAHPTRVNITFHEVEEGTRVDVVHTPGPAGEERYNEKMHIYKSAWTHVLEGFEHYLEQHS